MADDPGGRAFRNRLIDLDTRAIRQARRVFTNSKVVASRLARFNGIAATPLYPPLISPERFRNDGYGDEIVAISRVEPHKRQWLLVEAMRYVRTKVKLRICGASSSPLHVETIQRAIAEHGLTDRVVLEDRWISEEEKVERLATALAVAYVPDDEDSYGYPSLEAAHARKAVLTASDSGGVLELISDGHNGIVAPPDPRSLAQAMDQLYRDRALAARMGSANERRLAELRIDWPNVVDALTS